jgi:hypothetical protein
MFVKFREWREYLKDLRKKIDYNMENNIIDYKLNKITSEGYKKHRLEIERRNSTGSTNNDDDNSNDLMELIDLEDMYDETERNKYKNDTQEREKRDPFANMYGFMPAQYQNNPILRTGFDQDWDQKLEASILTKLAKYQATFQQGTFLGCVQLYGITAFIRFIAGFFP